MEKTKEISPTRKVFNTVKWVVIGVLIFLIVAEALSIFGRSTAVVAATPPPVTISNVFVDVNGDGKVDLIVSGEVIFNTGDNINLPLSQPTLAPKP